MGLPTKLWLHDDRVVVIARQTMTREFWARVFREERGISPECFASLDEWADGECATNPSLVVLYQSGIVQTEALAEVEQLSAQAADSPVVIVSDNEDPAAIVQMLGQEGSWLRADKLFPTNGHAGHGSRSCGRHLCSGEQFDRRSSRTGGTS